MKTLHVPQAIVFLLIASVIAVVVKNVLSTVDLNALEAANTASNNSPEEIKSAIWFVNHRDEAHKLIQECRKDIRLSYTENCINAEYAIKITGQ